MEQNLLIDELQPEMVQASIGKRLLNFIFDFIGIMMVLFLLVIFLIIVYPEAMEGDENGETFMDGIGFNIGVYFFFILYYCLFEYFTGGRTLGKLITGTRAVMEDGSKMGFVTSLKRNAIRIIPFEVLSYFGSPCYPWHDKWTKTYVIDIKKSNVCISSN
jgi:uncharacterized RDD family membrane protein YckC